MPVCGCSAVGVPQDVVQPSRYTHSPETRHAAMANFCNFHEIASVDERGIESSSLGITGWAFANVRDWSAVDLKINADDDRRS